MRLDLFSVKIIAYLSSFSLVIDFFFFFFVKLLLCCITFMVTQ